MNMQLQSADCIIGFGNYNDDIALRAAELYKQNYSDKILFTGNLGRNTSNLWNVSEAERFADIAIKRGVPQSSILIENRSKNTAENIIFTKALLAEKKIKIDKIIAVHQPFMERRIFAALKVYWPEVETIITSPVLTIQEYIDNSVKQGLNEKKVIDVIIGDFQRIDVYAQKGYQIPQFVPQNVYDAYDKMIEFGYTSELI